ncbi:MAG: hypothetical protein HUJ54_04210 [Erysipelotrichaceae bacterium]|nr:hypothetical protein [Erysipelotrichaceae bacterium]
MKKWLIQNSSRTAKVCTILGLVLVICYLTVIMSDWNTHRIQILSTAGPYELREMSNLFMRIAVDKCAMFLIPAALCGGTAFIMQYVPRAARRRMLLEQEAALHGAAKSKAFNV